MQVQDFTTSKLSKISEKSKWSQSFFVHMVLLYLSLPSRYNFSTFHRYGGKSESTYRRHFFGSHDMDKFNLSLIDDHSSSDIFWAFDPCYISKSGTKTYGLDTFWSGSANCSKKGLEIGSIAAVDVKQHTAFHYKVVQTASHKDRTASLLDYYSNILIAQKSALQTRSCVVVADAYFSKFTFVHPLCEAGFEVISRFRYDVHLRYLYRGPQKGRKGKNIGKGKGSGGGRPKTYDGKLDLLNLNLQHFTLCYHDEQKGETGYEAIVNAKALKKNVRVMVIHKVNKKGEPTAQVYFSTNIHRLATNLYVNYRLRFQQEFLFRDTKQFLGLQDCQARSKEKLDFHFNMSLTALNVAKAMTLKENIAQGKPFSMANIKTKYTNELLLNEAFDLFVEITGVSPSKIKNNPRILKLYQKGCNAA